VVDLLKMRIARDTCYCIIDLINKTYIKKCRIHQNSRDVKDCLLHNQANQFQSDPEGTREQKKRVVKETTRP